MMKTLYLDIMEKALSAYSPERIRDYIDQVKRDGLTEHGFPRLGANIGILIANGRCTELMDTFLEIMEICCAEIPIKQARNDFSIREVCCCLDLMHKNGVLEDALFERWRAQLATFDPWKFYKVVDNHSGKFTNNWALFTIASEIIRDQFCGVDTTDFIDWQLPSQLANFDRNGMYMDHPPYTNHAVYDVVPRELIAFTLMAGYQGKYAKRMEQILDLTADVTLQMQSVNGELAFGGRSNQFLNNEAMFIAYAEMEAVRFAKKGDMERAGKFRAAAVLAANALMDSLSTEPIHHIKNRYPLETKIGCESYGYFNKYMITVASNIYMALLYGDFTIPPTIAPALEGGTFYRSSENFHRDFLNCGGYFLQWDHCAAPEYDANGLGRIHKLGVPAPLCLSVPFPQKPNYVLEKNNPTQMSLCCFAEDGGHHLLGAERYALYSLADAKVTKERGEVSYDISLSFGIEVRQKHVVTKDGVEITLSGHNKVGFMIPVFAFDGEAETTITAEDHSITVCYQGSACRYTFDGAILGEPKTYYNRNGRYNVYAVSGERLHIKLEENADEL